MWPVFFRLALAATAQLPTWASAYEHEALRLEAQQQHLKRQSAALLERIGRLDHQARTRLSPRPRAQSKL